MTGEAGDRKSLHLNTGRLFKCTYKNKNPIQRVTLNGRSLFYKIKL